MLKGQISYNIKDVCNSPYGTMFVNGSSDTIYIMEQQLKILNQDGTYDYPAIDAEIFEEKFFKIDKMDLVRISGTWVKGINMLNEINIVVTELIKAGIKNVAFIDVKESELSHRIKIIIRLSDGYMVKTFCDFDLKEDFRSVVIDVINKILNHYKEGGEE